MKIVIGLGRDGSPAPALSLARIPSMVVPCTLRWEMKKGSEGLYDGLLHFNYCHENGKFARNHFATFKFEEDVVRGVGMVEIPIVRSGCFEYYVSYKSIETQDQARMHAKKHGYIIVDPILYQRGELLSLDGVALQTVVGKWMGPLSEWEKHLSAASENGYNMIHFTPLMQRGDSNSPYSLYDQMEFSEDLFDKENLSQQEKINGIHEMVKMLELKHGLLSMMDMVWNHTASNSAWLLDHPEAAYNLRDCPYLKAAYTLDVGIITFSNTMKEYGLSGSVNNEEELGAVMNAFEHDFLPTLKLWEYFLYDVESLVNEFREYLTQTQSIPVDAQSINITTSSFTFEEKLMRLRREALVKDIGYDRFSCKIEMSKAKSIFFDQSIKDMNSRIATACSELQYAIDLINLPLQNIYREDVNAIINNLRATIRYQWLQSDKKCTNFHGSNFSLVANYFTTCKHSNNDTFEEVYVFANNGWIWNADPLYDFAGLDSTAYFKREVIVWSDCVKLRYGTKRDDNPWLWDYMKKYTILMAKIFHAFRIDNCHSTPIHVAQCFIDVARSINPNLYVVAELFTGSEERDMIFVNQIGLNSLIRESMAAYSPQELSRYIHRYGGMPVGSFTSCTEYLAKSLVPDDVLATFFHEHKGSTPHTLFMDCTHDNETPSQKRTVLDALSSAALVAMAPCAIGSVRGFDELFPKHLDLVNENRKYLDPSVENGITRVKRELLKLHHDLAKRCYPEIYVHHENDFIAVHRKNPITYEGYFLIARTAFYPNSSNAATQPAIFINETIEVSMCASLQIIGLPPADSNTIRGFDSLLTVHDGPSSSFCSITEVLEANETKIIVDFNLLSPGSIILGRTKPCVRASQAMNALSKENIWHSLEWCLDNYQDDRANELSETLDKLDDTALNIILYRTDEEEKDTTPGNGVYYLPQFGSFPYAGIQGFYSVLQLVARNNDLGHPFCNNLRDGSWAIDYVTDRITRYNNASLVQITRWFNKHFELVKQLPRGIRPRYFYSILRKVYLAIVKITVCRALGNVNEVGLLLQRHVASSLQFYGVVSSASLLPKSLKPSLAAGLPHFATYHMRCWGRDTFISLPGLCIRLNKMEAAKSHIKSFASCLRHGLIPNLLDSGRCPRFNSRDAVWFFLYSVQCYCRVLGDGKSIRAFLEERIKMRFPNDNYVDVDNVSAYQIEKSMSDIIYEILSRHASGIHFREHNAGKELDDRMQDLGFQIDISCDVDGTGFISGGNAFNCGTWMDKMGESRRAGNFGVPATPRDGAAIEIIGLLSTTLTWLDELYSDGIIPYNGVTISYNQENRLFSFLEWKEKIQSSFERHFYVPQDSAQDFDYTIDAQHVNCRGIYKDTYLSSTRWTDYQFRPNFVIAMVVAPKLFNTEHALKALEFAKQTLLGPLGIKTLHPDDWAYRPNYANSVDSDDRVAARGFNYHQGPEWLWIAGYFYRAYYHFNRLSSPNCKAHETLAWIHSRLLEHQFIIESSPYAGLPELTNHNGALCDDACSTQAWSIASFIELLMDIAVTQQQ